jgi:signal transduction histidine kinase
MSGAIERAADRAMAGRRPSAASGSTGRTKGTQSTDERDRRFDALALTAVVAVAALALAVGLRTASFGGVEADRLLLVLRACEAIVPLLVAYVLWQRYTVTGTWRDLLLVAAMLLFGAGTLLFVVVPRLGGGHMGALPAWSAMVSRLLGAGALAAAALAPTERARPARLAALWLGAGCAAALVISAALVVITNPPAPLDLPSQPDDCIRLIAPTSATVALLGGSALFGLAAFAFARRGRRDSDDLATTLAVAAAIAGIARVSSMIDHTLYDDRLTTCEFLWMTFVVLLARVGMREVRSGWRSQAAVSVVQERRRMARDLHDGLSQELAYMSTQLNRLRSLPASVQPTAESLSAAIDRAMEESRTIIATLTRPSEEPFEETLGRSLLELGDRYEMDIRLRLDPVGPLAAAVSEALLRIAREALTNAARHGRSDRVTVELQRGPPLVLRVHDDGLGFDACAPHSGYGLTSMRERAHAVDARLEAVSGVGRGTTITVSR